jgi:hypothetical protein
MSAATFLEELRVEQLFLDFLLALMPSDRRASDLTRLPKQLRDDAIALGLPPELDGIAGLKWMFTTSDWAARMHNQCLALLPEGERERVIASPTFAVGSRPGSMIHAEAIPVPPYHGSGWVLLFDMGLFNFTGAMVRLVSLRMPPRLRNRITAYACSGAGLPFSFWQRLPSRLAWLPLARAMRHEPLRNIMIEFTAALHAYVFLGISILPPLPVVASLPCYPQAVGHPLECTGWLADACLEFAILHELSHVLCGHTRQTGLTSHEHEFAADRMALRFAVLARRSRPKAAAIAHAGAVFLLRLIDFVEQLDGEPKPDTHPKAADRIKSMYDELRSIDRRYGLSTELARDLAAEIDETLCALWQQCSVFRASMLAGRVPDVFETLLISSAQQQDPSKFQGQILRWMAFGGPKKLCQRIAREKATQEKLDTKADRLLVQKLEILNSTFSTLVGHSYTRDRTLFYYRKYQV